ncbi:MAG: 6,7-dimethyl-8-ribityllumazine synthase [Ignavibacteriae bacterium]|nr:MAG: 6,7-dimethyl-8-ribityllumazine synthase [Ignavibacteriota bacterium]
MSTQPNHNDQPIILPRGAGRRIGIVAARWHDDIVTTLLDGAVETLHQCGVLDSDLTIARCPGTYEIPVIASNMISTGKCDAVITLGVVVRGETAHFDYVAGPVAYGLQDLAISSGVPCIFGVLTTENLDQAWARAGGEHGHKGRESALAALETLEVLNAIT